MEPHGTNLSRQANRIRHPGESISLMSRPSAPKPARNPETMSSPQSVDVYDPSFVESAGLMTLSKISNDSHINSRNSTYLHHLDLGDVGTSRDMFECNPSCAWETTSSLQKHDFAFILRTDGRWTYAILADKQEKNMLFVVSLRGATKNISRNRFLDNVRLVNNSENLEKIDHHQQQNCWVLSHQESKILSLSLHGTVCMLRRRERRRQSYR
mmetsp:Transcript_13333/g.25467  ORF Transcript_13333/g.25467 Transcript_13333/m.25467 type:complete len:212 (+) Transcript_13333:189-824(+)